MDYAERRRRLAEQMIEADVEALFLPPSADLEYLTGLERAVPNFGNYIFAHGWVAGAFFRPGSDPVFVMPRIVVEFLLSADPPGELVVVGETDDGFSVFERIAKSFESRQFAIGDRTPGETVINLMRALSTDQLVNGSPLVAELRRIKSPEELEAIEQACHVADQAMAATTPRVGIGVSMTELVEEVDHQMRALGSRVPSFASRAYTFGDANVLDSDSPSTSMKPLREGQAVMFDFGAVVDGYCSDFGRTIFCGEPSAEYEAAYEIMVAAQAAGQAASKPGAIAAEVNLACRQPIEEAGLGEYFRHRMGHCIGLDVHERPFISEEDDAVLEAGMTLADEPSILWPGHFGVRIEDIVVCEPSGGRKLNRYPVNSVASTHPSNQSYSGAC